MIHGGVDAADGKQYSLPMDKLSWLNVGLPKIVGIEATDFIAMIHLILDIC